MWKLNEDMIGRIWSYPSNKTNTEIWKELGLDRHTVSKYRQIKEATQQQATDLLSGDEERMLFKQKAKELVEKLTPEKEKLSKQEKVKLSLLEHYTDKDIKEMLNYIATTKKQEIDQVLWIPWHLRFAMIGDTHIWAKECDLDAIHKFYEDAKAEWVEAFVHCGDLVDWCNVYKGQQFEQSEKWFDEQVEKVVKDYPKVWIPTYFIGGNHDQSYLTSSGADVSRTISLLRDDLINLGYYDATINLNGIKIQLQHGGWGNSYSKDYKLQRYIDSIEAWKEPDIFGLGHYHQAIHSLHRWIHGFMPGAFLKSNLLAKRFRFPNVIWGWIIDINKDEHGKKKLTATFLNE